MVAFQKARRVDQVGFANRVQNVIDRNPSRQQLGRLGDDVELRFLSSLNDDGRNALEPVQAWLHLVGCHLPQPGLGYRGRRQTVSHDGETGKGHAVSFDLGRGGQFRLHAGYGRVHVLQRLKHVDVPAKVKVDFCRAAAGDGAHRQQSRDAVHGLFDGPRHGHHHLVDGHDAVVDSDQDTRKIGGREDRDRNSEREIRAQQG